MPDGNADRVMVPIMAPIVTSLPSNAPESDGAHVQALRREPALCLMAGVTYDTGALVAAERNDRAMWALHAG